MRRGSLVVMLVSTFAASSKAAAPRSGVERLFSDWPAGASPAEVGRRLIANYLGRSLPARDMHYAEACTWYGALTTARLTRNTALSASLIKRFDPIQPGSPIIPSRDHVD